jgi:AcrR family transcriptional regulator
MKLRTQRPSDIRLGIVRAAGDLFHAQGLGSTTIDDIIEASGVAKAEFHQHFKSKSELATTNSIRGTTCKNVCAAISNFRRDLR